MKTPALETKGGTHTPITPSCLWVWGQVAHPEESWSVSLVTLVSCIGNEGTWGRGDAQASSSATSHDFRRNRHIWGTQSCSMADLRPWIELFWTIDLSAGLTGPWQGIRSSSHKPRGIFLAGALKTKQESFKMRLKGDKVECSNETLQSQPMEGQQV